MSLYRTDHKKGMAWENTLVFAQFESMLMSAAHQLHQLLLFPLSEAELASAQSGVALALDVQREQAHALLEGVLEQYTSRLGKGYGRPGDLDDAQVRRWLTAHVKDQSLDFPALCQLWYAHAKQCLQGGPVPGQWLMFARLQQGSAEVILLALLPQKQVLQMQQGHLQVQSILDLPAIQLAGRIDLTAWLQGTERCIGFLRGRGDGSPGFKRLLGCEDVMVPLKETQKLVQGLTRFAEEEAVPAERRDQVFAQMHGALEALGERGAPLALDELIKQSWPEAPARLQTVLAEQTVADGFVPDRRALKPLTRFKAAGEHWRLEFDRRSLRSGEVIYERQHDRLVLTGLPESLRAALQSD